MWNLLFKSLWGNDYQMLCIVGVAGWVRMSHDEFRMSHGWVENFGNFPRFSPTFPLFGTCFHRHVFHHRTCLLKVRHSLRAMSLSAATFAKRKKIGAKWRWSMMIWWNDEVWPYKILHFYMFRKFSTIQSLRPRFGHIQSNRKAGHLETQELNNTIIHWSRQKDPDSSFATVGVPNATRALDIDRESLKSPGKLRLAFVHSLRDVFQF